MFARLCAKLSTNQILTAGEALTSGHPEEMVILFEASFFYKFNLGRITKVSQGGIIYGFAEMPAPFIC